MLGPWGGEQWLDVCLYFGAEPSKGAAPVTQEGMRRDEEAEAVADTAQVLSSEVGGFSGEG